MHGHFAWLELLWLGQERRVPGLKLIFAGAEADKGPACKFANHELLNNNIDNFQFNAF